MTRSASVSPPDRATLRCELRVRRTAISASERIAAMQAVVAQLERIPEFLTDARIAGYWAVDGELPLAGVMHGIRARGQTYHLPIVDDKTLRFAPWQAGDAIVSNRYGIPEPDAPPSAHIAADQIDVVLLPMLGFDRRGNRLGFGGGFYDRTFTFLRQRKTAAQPLLVGIGFACQELADLPAMAWDVPLDFIATELELIECTALPA